MKFDWGISLVQIACLPCPKRQLDLFPSQVLICLSHSHKLVIPLKVVAPPLCLPHYARKGCVEHQILLLLSPSCQQHFSLSLWPHEGTCPIYHLRRPSLDYYVFLFLHYILQSSFFFCVCVKETII